MAQINVTNLTYCYEGSFDNIFENVSFSIDTDWKLGFIGRNGKGKTTFLKLLLGKYQYEGSIKEFCHERQLEESMLCTLLRQLGMERIQFTKNMEEYSEGQKKKVLIAASLLTSAHLYVWDEPLNYIDVFSRMQIEKLILSYKPTMLVVEHDVRFSEKLATSVLKMC